MLSKMLKTRSAYSKRCYDLVPLYQSFSAGRYESIWESALDPMMALNWSTFTWQTKFLREKSPCCEASDSQRSLELARWWILSETLFLCLLCWMLVSCSRLLKMEAMWCMFQVAQTVGNVSASVIKDPLKN